MSIKHWPNQERPREKLLSKGPENLSDAELLAIFLRTGIKGKSAVDLARDLLNQFGSLHSLLNANAENFCKAPGLGLAKYTQLRATLEISRRYYFESIQNMDILDSIGKTKRYLLSKLGDKQNEVFACLFLDNKHHLLSFKILFEGSIDRIDIYPRELIKTALAYNAAAIIFAHNHPSGDLMPSKADKQLTKVLKTTFDSIDIRVLDHLIVGKNRVLSFLEENLI